MACALGCSSGSGADGRPHNLLLISIDSLRADHLGCYGYARETSPTLDRLA
ncbi:MAG TPA: sulfatase-like hydrolase/transferase, partial [Candidatus Bathyarchaeia archaeon]|nr:sulfatase-like hydrolase/transferase [Candidatus Bathyarchaeia archaeon]